MRRSELHFLMLIALYFVEMAQILTNLNARYPTLITISSLLHRFKITNLRKIPQCYCFIPTQTALQFCCCTQLYYDVVKKSDGCCPVIFFTARLKVDLELKPQSYANESSE
jgi:hypothetical protein